MQAIAGQQTSLEARRRHLLQVRSASAAYLVTIQMELNAIERQLGLPQSASLVVNRKERRKEVG